MITTQSKTFNYYLIMLFLNSFVDLGHKITIQNTVFKVYDGQQQIILIAVVNSLILLPFILLFSPSAYFSNRYPLVKVMRVAAWIAFFSTLLITWFYYHGNYKWAFIMTLVLAIQSAVYSPAKYGYIKQLMGEAQLVVANARVQVATIIAILSGTLVFSILFELRLEQLGINSDYTEFGIIQAVAPLGWLLVISTAIELMMAYRLPDIPKPLSAPINFKWSEYLKGRTLSVQLSTIKEKSSIFYSIIGLSVFWGLSQMILAAFPAYAKQQLLENNTALIQAMLACSGIGIFIGSLLVGRLSRRTLNQPLAEWQLRKQMIPFGGFGLTVCLALLPFIESKPGLGLCFFGVGAFGAYFIVPLNAIIQSHARPDQVGTVLAGNNWVQNISMLGFLGLTIISASYGYNAVWLFYLIAVIAGVSLIVYLRHSLRDLLQFVLGGVFRMRYKVRARTMADFPADGGVLLLGNHVSWIDWALIQLVVPRPIRFVIDRNFYEHWLLNSLLSHIRTVAISPRRSKDAIKQIGNALRSKDVVCLFPEGRISDNGNLNEFKAGYALALKNTDAKIIPFYIHGMRGSRFSRVDQPRSKPGDTLRGNRRKIIVLTGTPTLNLNTRELLEEVKRLRDSVIYSTE
jgi:acyl-[acyl-carrier-protein]-phospholipid O-acyltransferase/long-chain-fatty-acid--[acyl-carrier-protein] ligase